MSQKPEHFEATSENITDEQKAKLLLLFPEIVTEGGKIDFDRLKLTLGESVDVGKERYGMNWPGKTDCFKTIQKPSVGTLVPARDESVNFDTTENLIIEGDNLETLKLLQKSYLGKVKMIYIDPPYNTGNDFIYPDDFSESLETYLRYTGQVDNEGRKFSTNAETDGRFHSKWMNMMYPRLFLARNLLRDDGVIFISIDDHEVDNLRKVCNEVFGEENFIAILNWVRTKTPAALATKTKTTVEYVLCYERQLSDQRYKGIEKPVQSSNPLLNRPNAISELIFPPNAVTTGIKNGVVKAGNYGTDNYEVLLLADALVENGKFSSELKLKARFRWSQSYLHEQLASGVRVHIATERMIPSYEKDSYGREALPNLIDSKVGVGTNEEATAELKALFKFGDSNILDQMHPKPVSMIKYLVDAVCDKDALVLDFFAGSGTTAQAVLELNKQDGGNRKYLLVQLPESTGQAEFSTIAEITKERLRRVIQKLKEADSQQPELSRQDRGFKVFKLQSSNFKAWNTEQPKDDAELVKQLSLHVDHLVAGRTQDDVLYELLLKSGFPLDTKVEKISLAGKDVFSIADGAMLICLEKELTPEVIKAMAEKKPERVVCLDAGFADNDQLKTNAVQTMKSKGVTKFQTV